MPTRGVDRLHKLSTEVIRETQAVYVEDLGVADDRVGRDPCKA